MKKENKMMKEKMKEKKVNMIKEKKNNKVKKKEKMKKDD